jgi:hypothetical protein
MFFSIAERGYDKERRRLTCLGTLENLVLLRFVSYLLISISSSLKDEVQIGCNVVDSILWFAFMLSIVWNLICRRPFAWWLLDLRPASFCWSASSSNLFSLQWQSYLVGWRDLVRSSYQYIGERIYYIRNRVRVSDRYGSVASWNDDDSDLDVAPHYSIDTQAVDHPRVAPPMAFIERIEARPEIEMEPLRDKSV